MRRSAADQAYVLSPLIGVLLLLQPGPAVAGDANFSGTLERVGSNSLSIKLADRRIIDAMLPNSPALDVSKVAAQYRMGDQLEIACHTIVPVWEEGTSRYQSLEVSQIQLVRRPSPEELLRLLGGVPFREGKNMLQHPELPPPEPSKGPSASALGGAELERARQVNLEYAENMPNFVADEKARRYRRGPGSSTWRDFDAVESEITFQGNHAARRKIRRDGALWQKPFEALPGFKWYEGFGTEIRPLFDPACPTTIEYHGHAKASGRPALEYAFRALIDGCFPFFFFDYQRYNPARTGRALVDESNGRLLQLDEQATGFPTEIQFAEREEHITWDYVNVAGAPRLLPVRASFLVRYYDGTRYRVEVEYRNHRHFETSTSITFEK